MINTGTCTMLCRSFTAAARGVLTVGSEIEPSGAESVFGSMNNDTSFDQTCELYVKGGVDARSLVETRVRDHGEGIGSWRPQVLMALPTNEVWIMIVFGSTQFFYRSCKLAFRTSTACRLGS